MRFIANAIRALRRALQPRTETSFDPIDLTMRERQTDQVLLRCRTDLPPVAGLFWFASVDLSVWFGIEQFIKRLPKNIDLWSLYTEDEIDSWMRQLPSAIYGGGTNKFVKVFDGVREYMPKNNVVAISALFCFHMCDGSLKTADVARVFLSHVPAPPFVGADNMSVDSLFLPVRAKGEPLGAWIPMFLDGKGRTHDFLDSTLMNSRQIQQACDVLRDFSGIGEVAMEGYLGRQMARFWDLWKDSEVHCRDALVTDEDVWIPRQQIQTSVVQAFLLAGACLPSPAWSSEGATENDPKTGWRPPLMPHLTGTLKFKGEKSSFANAVQRLMANGHHVLSIPSLIYFVQIGAHDAVALMLRLGVDPDEVVTIENEPFATGDSIANLDGSIAAPATNHKMSARECVESLNDPKMSHLLDTHTKRSKATSILKEMDETILV